MKRFFCLLGLLTGLLFLVMSVSASAQTPDTFTTQVTSSTRDSFTNGISGNGRFAVIESTANIPVTMIDANGVKVVKGDNEDGNREIFLLDYGQRRIFQITHTKSALLAATASPTPTPTPTATPTPGAPSTIDIEVSNNKPVISYDGRWIAFSSNAPNPASFDGTIAENRAALANDGNQEMFLYQIPAVANVDLTAGDDVAFTDLSQGRLTRLTDTPASRKPTPGSATTSPFVAFDNRDGAMNDDGTLLAFVSTRNLTGKNPDGKPELFIYNRANNAINQLTTSQGNFVFNESPSFNADGTSLVFISNATSLNIGGTITLTDAEGNGEIYLVNLTGGTAVGARQVTRTAASTNGSTVNYLNPGRRISRNGNYIALESLADLSGNGAIKDNHALYIYNVAANTFSQVGPTGTATDVFRFPTFSGDSSTLVFSSSLNFTDKGVVPTTATDGLNPNRSAQIFSIPVSNALSPLSSQTGFERLTNTPAVGALQVLPDTQAMVSETRSRMVFTYRGELGSGNTDVSSEVFYLLLPDNSKSQTPASANAVSYQTGASRRDVVTTTPTAPAVGGLAPGMLGIARSTAVQLAPASVKAKNASESEFRPSLPIELKGVSVSVNGVAAGLVFVSPGEIQFVVPAGLAPNTGTNTYPVVINNNGNVIRSTIPLLTAVPDILSENGRAVAFTKDMVREPFSVTTKNGNDTVPTTIMLFVTGVRIAASSNVTVRIKDTDITGTSIVVFPSDTPGVDQINVTLPATLAGAGDVPVIVTVSGSASRPADSAPRITIN